jgi:fatty acyl-CoA reductase
MVVNTMIAAMAKHGGGTATVSGAHVYHVTSSTVNPTLIGDQLWFMYQHFSKSPLLDIAGQPILVQPASTLGSMEEFVRYVRSNSMLQQGSTEDMSLRRAHSRLRAKAMEEQIIHLSGIYEPYTFCHSRFDSTNTEALFAEMSAQERARFDFDMRSVDWMDYITNVHIPGLRKHVLKEKQQQRGLNEPTSAAHV